MGETISQNMDGGSKKIKQKAARVCLMRWHKSIINYTRVPACLYMQKLSFKNKHFICIRVYGATILKWQLTKITASTPPHPERHLCYSCSLKIIINYLIYRASLMGTGWNVESKEQVSTPSQSKAEPDTWQCLHPQDKGGTVPEISSLLSSSLLHPLWFLLHTQTNKKRVWSCHFLDFHLLSRMTCADKHEASPRP